MTVTDLQQLIFDSVSLFYIHVHMHSIQETIQVVLVCFSVVLTTLQLPLTYFTMLYSINKIVTAQVSLHTCTGYIGVKYT